MLVINNSRQKVELMKFCLYSGTWKKVLRSSNETVSTLATYNELGGNKAKTARQCGVPRKFVQDWVRDRKSLEELGTPSGCQEEKACAKHRRNEERPWQISKSGRKSCYVDKTSSREGSHHVDASTREATTWHVTPHFAACQ
jgi:hypothetical protein